MDNTVAMEIAMTETGGSSTATVNSEMPTISRGSSWQFSTGVLINVPNHLRKLDEQAFTPLLISIGPIHRSNPKLQSMRKCKEQFFNCLIRRACINLYDLEQEIKSWEGRVRSYYAGDIVSSISIDDFVTMIRMDGLFILEYFLRQCNPDLVVNDHMIAAWMDPILQSDLVLLENQLPFFVLEKLFELVTTTDAWVELRLKPLSFTELAFKFFESYNFQKMRPQNICAIIEHFTDLVRWFHLGEYELKDRIFGGAKLSYSAVQLHEAGVKFEAGVEFDDNRFYKGSGCFLDISFNNGVLKIPCIILNDEKIRLIRNIIALEQSIYIGHAHVTDFFVILDFLINTSKDVDLLSHNGILVNYLGKAAAAAVDSLNTNILWDYMNPQYAKICEDLNAFYKTPWHRWKAILRHQYFSTPWRAASTSAAIILLLLTAIQTICSLRSTRW